MLTLLAVVLLSVQAGCPGGGGGRNDGGPAWVELGTGDVEFEALSAEQELVLVAGIQGGYHFVGHARMGGLLPGNPQVPGELGNPQTDFQLHLESGERVDARFPPYRLGYGSDGDAGYALPSGRLVQLDQDLVIGGLVPSIYGQRVRMTVTVVDASGTGAQDERWVMAIRDPSAPDAGPPGDGGALQ